jgi:hypothetical protein
MTQINIKIDNEIAITTTARQTERGSLSFPKNLIEGNQTAGKTSVIKEPTIA